MQAVSISETGRDALWQQQQQQQVPYLQGAYPEQELAETISCGRTLTADEHRHPVMNPQWTPARASTHTRRTSRTVGTIGAPRRILNHPSTS